MQQTVAIETWNQKQSYPELNLCFFLLLKTISSQSKLPPIFDFSCVQFLIKVKIIVRRKWIYKISMSIWWNRKGKWSQIWCSDFIIPKFVDIFKNQCVLCVPLFVYFLFISCCYYCAYENTKNIQRINAVRKLNIHECECERSKQVFAEFSICYHFFFQLQDAADFNWQQQYTHFLGVVIDSITYIWILSFKYWRRKHNMMLVASDLRKRKW